MSSDLYAAGRDYGFWLDIDGQLQVFGSLWTYNLPQTNGVAPQHNKKVIAVEEPMVGGVRPPSGGFMLGQQGQIIGIGYFDPNYWTSFPPDTQPPGPPPNIRIPSTVTGHRDIAGSSQMGTWVLDSAGLPQLVYISTLSPNYAAINGGTMTRPKPTTGTFVSIAVSLNNVFLLDGAGVITSFGIGTAPNAPIYPAAADGTFKKIVASTTHVAGITEQGKISWWPNVGTNANIQTPPVDKGYTDVAVGPDYSYGIIPLAAGAGAGVAGLATGAIECDTFERADVGSGWTTGPLFNSFGSTELVVVNRIVGNSLVTDDSDSQFPKLVLGTARTTGSVPAGQTQVIETTLGDMFPGATPGMSADFQIMEAESYLFTNVRDTPSTISASSGLNNCIALYVLIQMSSQDPDHDGQVYLELFTTGPDGTQHWDYGDTAYTQNHPVPPYTANGDYKVRLETDPDGTCRVYLQDALVITDILPTTGGTHVGLGSYWYTTNYDGHGGTRTPASPKTRTACGTGVTTGSITPLPTPNPTAGSPSQVRGFGAPLGATAGSYVVLVPDGHDDISQGPPVNVWGFAVVTETVDRPFGITPFGINAPDIPPASVGPNPPNAFEVTNYRADNNKAYLRWEAALSGPPAEFYEITRVPITPGPPPLNPPPGSNILTVRDTGASIQAVGYQIPVGEHGPAYFMIRAIGEGGVVAGGASEWVLTTFDNTLLTGDWRKITLILIDTDCQSGGFSIMVSIDPVIVGDDGWTGAQIDYDMIPPGIFYAQAGTKFSVAREEGPIVAGKQIAVADVNGLIDLIVPATPDTFVTAIIDYEISIEEDYSYWVHDSTAATTTGRENRITVAPLLDTCRSRIPHPHYLRCLMTPYEHVISDFCLGKLDQLDYDIRSGVFSVLGKPAPVVVVDTRSTATGRLIFMSSGTDSEARNALHRLRELVRMGHPMMLQTERDYELADGQLYFQPQKVSDRWIGDDARRPEHAFEVDFIEIDPPIGRVVLKNLGIPLSTPAGSTLKKSTTYYDWDGHKNPLFGMKFCDGGVKEQYRTCIDLQFRSDGSRRTLNEVFHTPDHTVC